MTNTKLKPAFYALAEGSWRDYVTLMHIPYTLWHLSYVVIGASAGPALRLDRLAGTLLAFFLAVGLAAHALDELHGRPLRTRIPNGWLLAIALISMVGALLIGALAVQTISLWALPFVAFGAVFVPAYNLEWWEGRLHSDVWFGIAWGAFPALVGYWANAERLGVEALLLGGACFGLSVAQRALSTYVKKIRRHTAFASGYIESIDGQTEPITIPFLLAAPELGLRLLGLSIVLLAAGLIVARL